MFKIDGIPSAMVLGAIIGLVVAFVRKGANTGDGLPFSGR